MHAENVANSIAAGRFDHDAAATTVHHMTHCLVLWQEISICVQFFHLVGSRRLNNNAHDFVLEYNLCV